MDRVRYDGVLPWPITPGVTGFSFQAIDPAQENSRVGNWSSSYSPTLTNGGWRFFGASGNVGLGEAGAAMRLLVYLDSPGSTILDDIAVVGGTNAAVGYNYVTNGDFELPLDSSATNGWKIGTNAYGDSLIVTDLVHPGTGAFKIIGTNAAGSANVAQNFNRSIYQFLSPAPAVNCTATLSFWYWATNSATNLLVPASSNTAPVLDTIGSKIIYLGQTLAFNATAIDADVAMQALTFSLDPTPPAGASISGAGAFTWTPASAGTNALTVRVTDNGVPARSDFESITVEVLAAPAFTSSLRNGDNFELTWRTRSGKSCAVDYKNDLNAPNWAPLWTNTAISDSLSFTNATTNAPQGFFRIRSVE